MPLFTLGDYSLEQRETFWDQDFLLPVTTNLNISDKDADGARAHSRGKQVLA